MRDRLRGRDGDQLGGNEVIRERESWLSLVEWCGETRREVGLPIIRQGKFIVIAQFKPIGNAKCLKNAADKKKLKYRRLAKVKCIKRVKRK